MIIYNKKAPVSATPNITLPAVRPPTHKKSLKRLTRENSNFLKTLGLKLK